MQHVLLAISLWCFIGSNVAEKIEISDELLATLRNAKAIDWCSELPNLSKCADGGTATFDDVLASLQTNGDVGSIIDDIERWLCKHLHFMCPKSTPSTTSGTTTPSNSTGTTSQKPSHTTADKRHTSTTPKHSNTTGTHSTPTHTTPQTTLATTAVPSSGGFSIKWFFVGVAVMLGVAIIILILIVVCKKVCARNAGPSYSQLSA